jgi:hypothetical protein
MLLIAHKKARMTETLSGFNGWDNRKKLPHKLTQIGCISINLQLE